MWLILSHFFINCWRSYISYVVKTWSRQTCMVRHVSFNSLFHLSLCFSQAEVRKKIFSEGLFFLTICISAFPPLSLVQIASFSSFLVENTFFPLTFTVQTLVFFYFSFSWENFINPFYVRGPKPYFLSLLLFFLNQIKCLRALFLVLWRTQYPCYAFWGFARTLYSHGLAPYEFLLKQNYQPY